MNQVLAAQHNVASAIPSFYYHHGTFIMATFIYSSVRLNTSKSAGFTHAVPDFILLHAVN